MKKGIIYLIILLSSNNLFSQTIVKGSGIMYTNGAPNHTPNTDTYSEIAIDTTNGHNYVWNRDKAKWQGHYYIDTITTCTAPTVAPNDKQSLIVINGCDSLYYYRSGSWRHINSGGAGGTVYYQLVRSTNSPMTQRNAINFLPTTRIGFVITDDGGANETEIEADIVSNSLTASEIAADAIGASELGPNAVDSSNIINGSISPLDFRTTGATSGQIWKYNGSVWALATDAGGSAGYDSIRINSFGMTKKNIVNFLDSPTILADGSNGATETEVNFNVNSNSLDSSYIH